MKNLCSISIVLLILLSATIYVNPTAAICPTGQGVWFRSSSGQPPLGEAHGSEQPPGREPLYVCRAEFGGGCHIGKIRARFQGCHIAYGGREYEIREYELLSSQINWITDLDVARYRRTNVSFHPGREGYGNYNLDMCRATYPPGTTGVHIGKIRSQFSGCHIPWGGVEVVVRRFDVAVLRN